MAKRENSSRRRATHPVRSTALPVGISLLVVFAATGCGRKATAEDCQRIVKRIAELELADVVPAAELGAEVEQAQQNFRERALADCVGRRITEASLECVAKAKTAASVIEDCFD